MRSRSLTLLVVGVSGGLALGHSPAQATRALPGEHVLSSAGDESGLAFNFAKAIAGDSEGRVHVVWYQGNEGGSGVLYRGSSDAGRHWAPPRRLSSNAGPSADPAIAVEQDRVHVVWHQFRDGQADVILRTSFDGGVSWEKERPVTIHSANAMHPSIAVSAGYLHIAYVDNRFGSPEILYRRSFDGGVSWNEERVISSRPHASWTPSIAAFQGNVCVAWVDTRDGNEEEYVRCSRDHGSDWGPLIRVTEDPANSWAPSLVVADDKLHLAWFDQMDSPVQPLEAERGLDPILGWLGFPIEASPKGVLIPHPLLGQARVIEEKLELVEGHAETWLRSGGDPHALHALRGELEALVARDASLLEKDQKASELVALLRLTYDPKPRSDIPQVYYLDGMQLRIEDKLKAITARAPAWVARGGNPQEIEKVLHRFERALQTATRSWEIYYRVSPDLGRTWQPIQRLTHSSGASQRPNLSGFRDSLVLVWFDDRDGDFEIYSRRQLGGFWGPEVRFTHARGASTKPSVASLGATHVVWLDERDGTRRLYYRRQPTLIPDP